MQKVLSIFVALMAQSSAFAQPPDAALASAPAAPTKVDDVVEAKVEAATKESAKSKFAGLDFAVGVGVMISPDNTRIEDAVLVPADPSIGGPAVVRVKTRRNHSARVFLESHYFFMIDKPGTYGHGPFIALQPGTDDIIQTAALGWMAGARHTEKDTASFNIGIGVAVEPTVKELGDGIVPNQPLPAGETALRYQEKPMVSLLVLGSFSF
ncbi:MAG TPA: hypothetical protein VGF45_15240 [Polyangia bacterium]